MTAEQHSDKPKIADRRRVPGTGWAFCKSLSDIRSLVAIFTFLFLLAMPIALLLIGRENFAAMAEAFAPQSSSSGMTATPWIGNTIFGKPLPFNAALLPFHHAVTSLAAVGVLIMGSALFRRMYRRDAVDAEWSMPLTKNSWSLGRALALAAGIAIPFAANAGAAAGILAAWGRNFTDLLLAYSQAYLLLFLASLNFAGFTVLLLSLSGRLFDALVILFTLHFAWPVPIYGISLLATENAHHEPIYTWLLAPAADMFRLPFIRQNLPHMIILPVFWFVLAWFSAVRRPAERAGIKTGNLRWFRWIQPVYSMAGGWMLGAFFSTIFRFGVTQPGWAFFLSPSFVLGMLPGAFLGQILSSVITGKRLRRDPHGETGSRTLHPLLAEWLWSLLGMALLYALVLLNNAPPLRR